MPTFSAQNHRTVGRHVPSIKWPEPTIKTCKHCGLEFLEMRIPALPCCDACNKIAYEAWMASYCPPKKKRRASSGVTRKDDDTPMVVAKAVAQQQSLTDRIAALKAALAATQN